MASKFIVISSGAVSAPSDSYKAGFRFKVMRVNKENLQPVTYAEFGHFRDMAAANMVADSLNKTHLPDSETDREYRVRTSSTSM